MKTKIYLLLIACLTSIGSILAQEFIVDGIKYRVTNVVDREVGVMRNDNMFGDALYAGDLVIPATVVRDAVTYDVTGLEDEALRYSHDVTSITIQDGTKPFHVGSLALHNLRGLRTLRLPKNLAPTFTSIAARCQALEVLILENGDHFVVENGILFDIAKTTIYKYPSKKNGNAYSIPSTVTDLAEYSFDRIANLNSIHIPASLTTIADRAFEACFSVSEIRVAAGNPNYKDIDGVLFNKAGTTLVTYPIGNVASSYNVPDGVTTIGVGAFTGGDYPDFIVSNLTSIDLNGVTSLEQTAFRACVNLKTVTGGGQLTNIGADLFRYCTSLETIPFSIFSNLITISTLLFKECGELTGVFPISASVLAINRNPFKMSGFNAFSVDPANTRFKDIDGVLYRINAAGDPIRLIAYPSGKEGTTFEVPSTVTEIVAGAFQGSMLEKIIIGDVATVGELILVNSNVSEVIFTSATPPLVDINAFRYAKEDLVVIIDSNDPDVFAAYQAELEQGHISSLSSVIATLTFNNGTPNKQVGNNWSTGLLEEPETPTRSGYIFDGWYDAATGGNLWDFDTDVASNGLILYAYWSVAPAPPVIPTYTVTVNPLSGVRVNKSSTTVGEGNSFSFTAESTTPGYSVNVSVNGSAISAVSGITYLIGDIRENKTVTFSLTAGGATPNPNPDTDPVAPGDGDGTIPGPGEPGGSGQIIIDENSPSELPGEFPGDGQIIVRPPLVDPDSSTPPTVIIDGKEVEGEWKTDEDGNPVFVIDLDGLEDGKHTIIINDKEFEFTVNKDLATSNDVLSTTKIVAGHGTITVSVAQPTHVQIVSMAGAVVYNANVASETVVSLPQGLYIVKAGASGVKVVVR